MQDNNFAYWVKVSVTIILAILGIGGILGYFYLDIRGFYRKPTSRWWVGLLATGLPLISITFGIMIWMLWNPLLRNAFWPLFIVGFFISLLLGQSVTSPYKLADWWIEFGKWLQKRKSK